MINNIIIQEYYNFFILFFSSASCSFLFIKFFPIIKHHVYHSNGPQKIHTGDVSRLGGLSIFLTFFVMLFYQETFQIKIIEYLICILPVFLIGLVEDITQRVKPTIRLMSAFISSVIFIYITDITINRLGFYIGDLFLNYKPLSIVFTILCIAYLTQAFNIIDGLNGLSLCTSMICLLSLAMISENNLNYLIFQQSLNLIFILLGVLLFNFFGKIFIGDSGAYLIGFIIATIAINFSVNNHHLSPFVIVLILFYPSWELLRTILRRVLNKKNIFSPDAQHLHSLLYSNNLKRYKFSNFKANLFTSLQIIFFQLVIFIYVISFYRTETLMILGIAISISFYELIYKIEKKYLDKQA